MTLSVAICTPQEEINLQKVHHLVVITDKGELAVYPRHTALVALLLPGVARIHFTSKTERWELSGGILDVKGRGNEVVLIVESARRLKISPSSSFT